MSILNITYDKISGETTYLFKIKGYYSSRQVLTWTGQASQIGKRQKEPNIEIYHNHHLQHKI